MYLMCIITVCKGGDIYSYIYKSDLLRGATNNMVHVGQARVAQWCLKLNGTYSSGLTLIYSYYHTKTQYQYHKLIAKYYYKCEAQVTIPKAMNE